MSVADFEWQTVRPWMTRISLQIREVTSVSVAFILRSSMGASRSETLAVLGSDSDEDDDSRMIPAISDLLGRGLAVKVNGNNWKRAVVHVDEHEEEAVVIVYGLMPRKKYEISLSIAASDEPMQETITTQSGQDERLTAEMPGPTNELVIDSAISPSTLTPPTTPVRTSPPRAVTQEERASQLRKQLAILHTERDELASQLKATRRESQRTETALKGEIETLKRASEKHASGEHRSRQKVLALQEAVKQASAATEDIEAMVRELEAAMPGFNTRTCEVETEHRTLKEEAERRSADTNIALQADNKIVADLQGELRGVCARLEKVTGKHQKLEKEVVPQLEERLQELRREIAEIERTTPDECDLQPGNEEVHSPWSARNWVPPIQRPSHRRPSVTSLNFSPTQSLFSPSRQNSFQTPRPPTDRRSTITLPSPLPSYDSNFLSRALVAGESVDPSSPSSRVTSDLKFGSTFHTPPRFPTQGTSYASASPYDFIAGSRSPNSTNGDRPVPPRQVSFPSSDFDIESHGNQ